LVEKKSCLNNKMWSKASSLTQQHLIKLFRTKTYDLHSTLVMTSSGIFSKTLLCL